MYQSSGILYVDFYKQSVSFTSTPPQIKTSKNEYCSNSMEEEEKGRGLTFINNIYWSIEQM